MVVVSIKPPKALPVVRLKWNPDQPRDAAGTSTGGQWTAAGAGAVTPPGQPSNPAGVSSASAAASDAQSILPPDIYDQVMREIKLGKGKEEQALAALDQRQKEQAGGELAAAIKNAHADKPAFDSSVKGIAETLGGKPMLAPVKGGDRLLEKHVWENGSDPKLMRDLVRGTVVIRKASDAPQALAEIGKKFEITRLKDRFETPLPTGYRDILVNVRLPSGIEGEIQVHIKEIMAVKPLGHQLYDVERKLPAGPKKDELTALSKSLYDAAYKANQRSKRLVPVTSQRSNSARLRGSPSVPAFNSLGYGRESVGLLKAKQLPSGSMTTGTPSTSRNLDPAGTFDKAIPIAPILPKVKI